MNTYHVDRSGTDYFFLEALFLALGAAAAGLEEGLPKAFGPFAGLFAMIYDFKLTR
jgi:hypothetical protein